MNTITVVVRRSSDRLGQRLEQRGAFLDALSYRCSWSDCGGDGKMLSLIPGPAAAPDARQKIIEELAPLMTQFIIEDLKAYLLLDLLRSHYFYFGRKEREEILAIACRSLESINFNRRRKFHRGLMGKDIRLYLAQPHDHINIEGFYCFRLHDWRRELQRVIDEAVESYLAEKEHREFVRLLKYFLSLQQPRMDLLHLFLDQKRCIRITDQRFKKIDSYDWEEFDMTGFDGESDYEDVLVSMLVSIAPRRIMLHQGVVSRYPKAVETLRSIFEKRLIYCDNCSYCRSEKARLIDSNPLPPTR